MSEDLKLPPDDALVAAVLSGLATPAQRGECARRLAADPAFRALYSRQAETEGFLHLLLGGGAELPFAAPARRPFPWLRLAAALAVLLGSAAALARALAKPPAAEQAAAPSPAAAIILSAAPARTEVRAAAVQTNAAEPALTNVTAAAAQTNPAPVIRAAGVTNKETTNMSATNSSVRAAVAAALATVATGAALPLSAGASGASSPGFDLDTCNKGVSAAGELDLEARNSSSVIKWNLNLLTTKVHGGAVLLI